MTTSTGSGAGRGASPFLYGPEEVALCEALRSGQYGHNEVTDRFEAGIAQFLGVPDTVAVASGTDALHIALRVAGIGPGHEVIVPSLTFCASVQAILACGARPVFVEVDPGTLCVQEEDVLAALTPGTRAVMPVLYGGRAVDLSGIGDLLAARGVVVVEDAAHAFGSFAGARRVGATGLLTCFSFGPIKNLTCGQGGMIVPRDPQEAQRARRLRGLGIVQSPAWRAGSTTYAVGGFGLRSQMSSLNAAIGLAQLGHFPTTEARRRTLWRCYAAALAGREDVALVDVDVDRSVPHLCAVQVPERDCVFRILRGRGIGVGAHYPPNHAQPAFAPWYRPLPVTEAVGQQILTLPFHQHMTEADVSCVVRELGQALAVTETSR